MLVDCQCRSCCRDDFGEVGITAMNLEAAVRDLAQAVAAADGPGGVDRRLRAARDVLARLIVALSGCAVSGQPSVVAAIRLAVGVTAQPARRDCAVLVVHALAVHGLVPATSFGDVCALVEGALRGVLVRCGYPFGGSLREKCGVLQRLHRTIEALMQPLEPTFPGWLQGMHAG
jgi:hypothetical protein